MKMAISKQKFNNIKINDKVKLHDGSFGLIKKINKEDRIHPIYVELLPTSGHSPYSAQFNSGWKEELMIVDILD